ncbi:nose resistant to fluoxetine protein 6-like [Centruroides sculpturatus]|uniref:nose resistant to fluoxetine protein 6-like n=1 Tax=Centruroides sculpturatus TaxID=218467 RepID=UPI000C6D1EC6|nr:nose resistant to fluoxetine protein 6-like [Centruroides sculpturatus]
MVGDAWGKPPGGMLTGSIAAFGSYKECLDIEAIENGKLRFRGKYCLYDFRPLVPPKPRFYTHKSIVPVLKNLSLSGTVQGENAKLAHYFYFLSMRFGVCFPSTLGDAWGKPPGGMLTGSIAAFGSYKECLDIEAIENGKLRFTGKYCLYDFRPLVPPKPRFYTHKSIVPVLKNLSLSGTVQGENAKLAHYFYFLSMRFGVCFPSTCTNNDILNICSQFPKHFEIAGYSNVPHCEIKESKKISPFQATYIAIVSFLGLITLISTLLDVILTRKAMQKSSFYTSTTMRVFLCFSLKKNFPRLMSTDIAPDALPCLYGFRFFTICWVVVCHSYLYVNYGTLSEYFIENITKTNSVLTFSMRVFLCFSLKKNFPRLMSTDIAPDALPCLYGFRFFTICWVVVCHSYLYVNYGTLKHASMVGEVFSESIPFQVVLNSAPAVDSFFFLSGFLSVYGILKAKEKGIHLDIKLYIFHRLWRLSPAYFMSVASMFFLPLLGSGPIWHVTLDFFLDKCRKNWWTNLIFLNNFINSDEMCIESSWYMAVDFQLHLLGLAVLIPLIKWPVIAVITGSFITAAATITAGLINYFNDLPPTPLAGTPDPDDRAYALSLQYFKPYIHIGPYMVGMALGYLFLRKPKIQIKPIIQIALWLSSTAIAMSIVYSTAPWNGGYGYSVEIATIYSAFSKTAWSLSVAWLIYACITGHAGFINTILSWKAWIPFSRLSFTIYLIHPLVQWVYMAYQHERMYPSHHTGIYLIFGHFMISLGIALVVSLMLESPFMNLEKIIFSRKRNESFDVSSNGKLDSLAKNSETEMKPRFISQNSNGITHGITNNGGIENKGFSSHL